MADTHKPRIRRKTKRCSEQDLIWFFLCNCRSKIQHKLRKKLLICSKTDSECIACNDGATVSRLREMRLEQMLFEQAAQFQSLLTSVKRTQLLKQWVLLTSEIIKKIKRSGCRENLHARFPKPKTTPRSITIKERRKRDRLRSTEGWQKPSPTVIARNCGCGFGGVSE